MQVNRDLDRPRRTWKPGVNCHQFSSRLGECGAGVQPPDDIGQDGHSLRGGALSLIFTEGGDQIHGIDAGKNEASRKHADDRVWKTIEKDGASDNSGI